MQQADTDDQNLPPGVQGLGKGRLATSDSYFAYSGEKGYVSRQIKCPVVNHLNAYLAGSELSSTSLSHTVIYWQDAFLSFKHLSF